AGADCIRPSRLVALLLGARGPAAVAGFVATRVVEPIERMPRGRARTKIGQERHEVVAPPRADADSARAIGVIARVARVGATADHPVPNVVFGAREGAPRTIPESLAYQRRLHTIGASLHSRYYYCQHPILHWLLRARRQFRPGGRRGHERPRPSQPWRR